MNRRRPIPGYGSKYTVFEEGLVYRAVRVESDGTIHWKRVSTWPDRGRERITLYRNGKRWSPYLSVLLERVFSDET